jgi:teichuronic acid biosynthesis protein TuaE
MLTSILWTNVELKLFFAEAIIISTNILVIFLSIYYIRTLKQFKFFFLIWVLGFLALMPIGLWEIFTQNHLALKIEHTVSPVMKYSPSTVYYNTNDFSFYLILSFSILYSVFKHAKNIIFTWLIFALMLICLFLTIYTFSRSAYLAIGFMVIFDLVFLSRVKNKMKTILYSVIVFSVIVVFKIEVIINSILPLVENLETLSHLDRTDTRYIMFIDTLNILANTYLLGGGPNTFSTPHNFLLEILADYGIIIFIMWVVMYGYLIKEMFNYLFKANNKIEKMLSNGLFLGLIGSIPGSISASSIIPIIPFWMFIGVSLAYINYRRNQQEVVFAS